MKIGLIGAGNMGSAMIRGWLRGGVNAQDIYVKGGQHLTAASLQHELGFNLVSDTKSFNECDMIILAVKSSAVESVLEELYMNLDDKNSIPVVSIASGISMENLQAITGKEFPLVISIPNMPVQVNKGILLTIYSNVITMDLKDKIEQILSILGRVVETGEAGLEPMMAIAGCGPAFVDVFIEAMADGAVLHGIPRNLAYELVGEMMSGSAILMLESQIHPAILKDMVSTPGGDTIKGLVSLEENGFRNAVIKAVSSIISKK